MVLNRLWLVNSGFDFLYLGALQFGQRVFVFSLQTHPVSFLRFSAASGPQGVRTELGSYAATLLCHQSDARGMNRCVSMPVVFKTTYQNIDLIPCVLKLEGRDIKFIPCGFFVLIFFFTEYLFLVSIFGHTLCFL